ncbi:hypothetical protein KEU06_05870 [Pseudaminobacter sp. 19-2017]|uniref:Uncharacterized protein n=1 Tax=Pseudaminobacter soli (ex Zhang et al. 2022) TaxID=2831468 RepID=A0A942I245_9HYPH|nr:hypothetical protein [Pseudaminobacter soli]MBS3648153.1 hypothetical protein [Pseudaminobacter soli]
MRALYIAFSFLCGCFVSIYWGEYVVGNEAAIGIFVTVYTVLAGFLVAVIAILGDPSLLPSGSWRSAEGHRQEIEDRLIRHTWLFVLYLVTIGVIFVGALLSKAPEDVVSSCVKAIIAHIHLGLGVAAFILTLGMPKMLMDIQRKRVDAEIDRRRAEAGIKD